MQQQKDRSKIKKKKKSPASDLPAPQVLAHGALWTSEEWAVGQMYWILATKMASLIFRELLFCVSVSVRIPMRSYPSRVLQTQRCSAQTSPQRFASDAEVWAPGVCPSCRAALPEPALFLGPSAACDCVNKEDKSLACSAWCAMTRDPCHHGQALSFLYHNVTFPSAQSCYTLPFLPLTSCCTARLPFTGVDP